MISSVCTHSYGSHGLRNQRVCSRERDRCRLAPQGVVKFAEALYHSHQRGGDPLPPGMATLLIPTVNLSVQV